jgi:hypothetical protein
MTARGLLAPLSPNEELTLRRVASGTFDADELSLRDLGRLRRLGLVEVEAGNPHLTPLGCERFNALAHVIPSAPAHPPSSSLRSAGRSARDRA